MDDTAGATKSVNRLSLAPPSVGPGFSASAPVSPTNPFAAMDVPSPSTKPTNPFATLVEVAPAQTTPTQKIQKNTNLKTPTTDPPKKHKTTHKNTKHLKSIPPKKPKQTKKS